MNQGRIWCVVNPSIGLPAFLGGVALISFTVHFAVLDNTTWMKDFFAGSSANRTALNSTASHLASARGDPAYSVKVLPTGSDGAITVTVTPRDPSMASAAAKPTAG